MRISRIAGVAVLVAVFTGAAAPAQAQLNLTSITDLENVAFDAATRVLTIGSATLTGTLNGIPFTTDITNLTLGPAQPGSGSCSVLDLTLGPINVSLLGLHVDTSPICLTITAQRGQGILGNLLCSLANVGGVVPAITHILNNPNLLSGLSNILNQLLNSPSTGNGSGTVCSGQCTVLDLVLGPLTLTLLGVTVHLDNCSDNAIEVCVSATQSTALTGGGVLGDILCGLAGGGPLDTTLNELLTLIEGLIPSL
jgi:hypothetical protein